MKKFAENLKSIPTTEKTVLLRLYNDNEELVSIIPNVPGRQGSIQVFQHIAGAKGQINFEEVKFEYFGDQNRILNSINLQILQLQVQKN